MTSAGARVISPGRFRRAAWYSEYASARGQLIFLVGFIAAHVPIGLLVYRSRHVATAHAFFVVAGGLALVAFGRPERAAYVGAYIAGAEVIWRMTKAPIPWEIGKYATTVVMLVALIKIGLSTRIAIPALYFALLVPSAVLTVSGSDASEARNHLSFNLSGPLALAATACFFSSVRVSREQLQRTFLMLVGPAVSVGSITLLATVTAENLNFGSEANEATSAGFGPNQVSGVLGLGAMLAFLYILYEKNSVVTKAVMLCVVIFLACESALTFSRSGLYNAVGAICVGLVFLFRDSRSRLRAIAPLALLALASALVVVPYLDSFTGGALTERFENTDTTGRVDIMKADLAIWADNPALGVGPGMSKLLHGEFLERGVIAHTELTRLLSEHGLFGLLALLLLIALAALSVLRARTAGAKSVAASAMVWSFLFMLNTAMRLVAPSFMFGLGCAAFALGEQEKGRKPRPSTARVAAMHPLRRPPYGPRRPGYRGAIR